MAKRFDRQRVGEARTSQLLYTYGIGSIVDLPKTSAIVEGLDSWPSAEWDPQAAINAISEERLLTLVRAHLGKQVKQLCRPPRIQDNEDGAADRFNPAGVPVSTFPKWVRCPKCELLAPLDFGVFQLKANPFRPDQTRYVHTNCPKWQGGEPDVIPVRFVVVCERGHLSDFPWHQYVHAAKKAGTGGEPCSGTLRLQERGVSTEVADLWVGCDKCGARRPLTYAFGEAAKESLGRCPGMHPHLGPRFSESCDAEPRTMLLGASNMWFPLIVSALSLPTDAGKLETFVEEYWPVLDAANTMDVLKAFRKIGTLQAFAPWSDDELWAAVEARRNNKRSSGGSKVSDLKIDEWALFSRPETVSSTKDFRLRKVDAPAGYDALIQEVVLVERLRSVNATTGFTRIGSPGDYADLSDIPEIRRAPLARSAPTWVPASEVRGEGIFIRFPETVLVKWLEDPSIEAVEEQFRRAHIAFRSARKIEPPDDGFFITRYALLHTLSHVLIRQFSIECGYSAASIQERIYSAPEGADTGSMAGILLYTAAADSEGTLGGLVGLGDPITLGRHLDQALERARLCSSDPLCSEHRPLQDGRTLHGAACHACLFVSETSCERGNKYLDRSLLVETIAGTCKPYFTTR